MQLEDRDIKVLHRRELDLGGRIHLVQMGLQNHIDLVVIDAQAGLFVGCMCRHNLQKHQEEGRKTQ